MIARDYVRRSGRWLRAPLVWWRRHWIVGSLLILGVLLTWGTRGVALIVAIIVIAALGTTLLRQLLPQRAAAIDRAIYLFRLQRALPSLWTQVAVSQGLGNLKTGAPPIGRIEVVEYGVAFRPQLRAGEVVQQVEHSAEALRQACGAVDVRVSPVGDVEVVLYDYLAGPINSPQIGVSKSNEIALGLTARARPWRLPLGPSTLVAGSSGSGKASLVWGLLRAIAPEIRAGSVEVHGIDLKGGMELGLGSGLLSRYATSPQTAVQLLEEAVQQMRSRAGELAGVSRTHSRSPASPHVVILIDELAALTAYITERDLQKRANAALNLLLSQGRAVGFTVFACLQDPRKEVIPSRGLFLQTVGLRLRDRHETAMVLGEGPAQLASCDRIPLDRPGTAYVLGAEGGAPELVRAAFVDDDEIRRLSDEYPALRPRPIVPQPKEEPAEQTRRTRGRRAG